MHNCLKKRIRYLKKYKGTILFILLIIVIILITFMIIDEKNSLTGKAVRETGADALSDEQIEEISSKKTGYEAITVTST